MRTKYIFLIFGALIFQTCFIPIHSTRVILIENFTQSFDFGNLGKKDLHEQVRLLLGLNKSMEDKFISKPVRKLWASKSFVSKGNVVLTISLVPQKDLDKFYISGFGSYDIVNEANNKIYFSAKFNLIDTIYYSIKKDLKLNKEIPVKFNHVITNHFTAYNLISKDSSSYDLTYEKYAVHSAKDVTINVKIKKIECKDIFMLDYAAKHEVTLGEEAQRIGDIKFKEPKHIFDKAIDMRKLKMMVRRNYKKYR